MSTDTSGAELFNACFDGELDDAVKLLKAGADVDFADEECGHARLILEISICRQLRLEFNSLYVPGAAHQPEHQFHVVDDVVDEKTNIARDCEQE
eukprot:scaffold1010_cov20-Tisochrysis_lutea.AAC.2